MEKNCTFCKIKYEAQSNRSTYCSIECKKKTQFYKNQERIIREGKEHVDYIIDKWNGYVTPRLYGAWMRAMHPGRTTKEYLKEFPGSYLCCEKDKNCTTKCGQENHMKKPKYRKMASDAIKGIKNPNHKSCTTDEVRSSRSPFSLKFKNYKSKEDRDNFVNNIDWAARITSTQVEWWLNKGFSKEEAKIKLEERQSTFTLKKCIKKYGEVEGTKKFNTRQTKWKKSLHENFAKYGDSRSPSSKFASSIITELCKHLKIEVPKKEKWIHDVENDRAYSYDFTYKKKIIEFNGDYWHCNPLCYESGYFHKSKGLSAKEIWEYDNIKITLPIKYDYEVLVIWEKEFNDNRKQTIEKCIHFLNN